MNKQLMTELYEGAKVVEKNLGIPALFQVAQAIQESGWDFKYTPPNSFNIFGIKWHGGDFVESWTQEWNSKKGGYDDVLAKFQKYKSYIECFADHASLLTQEITSERARKLNPQNPMTYKKALEQYKKDKNLKTYVENVAIIYATSLVYDKDILNLMEDLKKVFGLDKLVSAWVAEKDEAKKWAVEIGLVKEPVSWDEFIDRKTLVVILKRLLDKAQEV